MPHSVVARCWIVSLLLLVFCTGVATSALARLPAGGHPSAAGAAAHAACPHMAPAAVQDAGDDGSTDISDAADCALAHLGQALLDQPVSLLVSVNPCTYPPAPPFGLVNRVSGPETDPPKAGRVA